VGFGVLPGLGLAPDEGLDAGVGADVEVLSGGG
jgi:hypothetical protein